MGSEAIDIYKQSLIKIGSDIQKLMRGGIRRNKPTLIFFVKKVG
jgi:hypothetical protein